jgi:hypothetical protein
MPRHGVAHPFLECEAAAADRIRVDVERGISGGRPLQEVFTTVTPTGLRRNAGLEGAVTGGIACAPENPRWLLFGWSWRELRA